MNQIQANLGVIRKADTQQDTNVLRRDPLTGSAQVIKKTEPSTAKPFDSGSWGNRLLTNLKKAETQKTAHTCAQKSEPKSKPAEPKNVGNSLATVVKKVAENVEITNLKLQIQKLEADVRERDRTIESLQAKKASVAKNEQFNKVLLNGNARSVRFATGMAGLL